MTTPMSKGQVMVLRQYRSNRRLGLSPEESLLVVLTNAQANQVYGHLMSTRDIAELAWVESWSKHYLKTLRNRPAGHWRWE